MPYGEIDTVKLCFLYKPGKLNFILTNAQKAGMSRYEQSYLSDLTTPAFFVTYLLQLNTVVIYLSQLAEWTVKE